MVWRATWTVTLVLTLIAGAAAAEGTMDYRYGELHEAIDRMQTDERTRAGLHAVVGRLADAELALGRMDADRVAASDELDDEGRTALEARYVAHAAELSRAVHGALEAARRDLAPGHLEARIGSETDEGRRAVLKDEQAQRRTLIHGLDALRESIVQGNRGPQQVTREEVTQVGDRISNLVAQVHTMIGNAVRR